MGGDGNKRGPGVGRALNWAYGHDPGLQVFSHDCLISTQEGHCAALAKSAD